ncbi:hypothetical protein NL500_31150, partial [Klebsiella pneumoniae]|nr:hypothetical protein [Klebsiella pneumoniae]
AAIKEKNTPLVDLQYERYNELTNRLREYNVITTKPQDLNETLQNELEQEFKNNILPTLTPLGIDAYHPFPKLVNKSLN